MADLNDFIIDRDAVRDGEWITVGDGGNTFEIRTRGFTPKYRDALNALRRHAARDLNRKLQPGDAMYSADTLPPSADDRCQGQATATHCVMDVRGLTSKGVAVTVEQFRDLLSDPEGRTGLLILAIGAASRVGTDRKEETAVAEGNSLPA